MKVLILILMFGVPLLLVAKIDWIEHNIESDFAGARSVFAIDLDRDDDIDVLGAASEANAITWWENDGTEKFTEHAVADTFLGARSVSAIDLDQDSTVDILGAASMANDLLWWRNEGVEHFTEQKIGRLKGGNDVSAIDLDNDDDIDLLSASHFFLLGEISWWENDGAEMFTKHAVDSAFNGGYESTQPADVNGDGDVDILSAALAAGDITWWENAPDTRIGWIEHPIDTAFDGASSVCACDLDQDGDIDVLGAASVADDISWWENDGNENFTEHVIDSTFDGACDVVCAADLDSDGDIDVLGAASDGDVISWWENDGSENFTEHIIVWQFFDGASSVYAIDLDGDEDLDVLGTAANAGKITWWENTTLDVQDFAERPPGSFFHLANNPVKGKTLFNVTLPQDAFISLRIYDASGRLIDRVVTGRNAAGFHQIPWTAPNNAGVYFYVFESPGHKETGKLVLIQ